MDTLNEYPNIAEMTAEQLEAFIAKDGIDLEQYDAATKRPKVLRKKNN